MNNKTVDINDITSLSNVSWSCSQAGSDYFLYHFKMNERERRDVDFPVAFDGIALVLVMSGGVGIHIGASDYTLHAGTATILGPNDMITGVELSDGVSEFYTLFVSTEFLNGMNFDVNVINPRYLVDNNPILRVNATEVSLVTNYLNLLNKCAVNNNNDPIQQLMMISRSIGRNIVVALMYQLAYMREKQQLVVTDGGEQRRSRSRKVNYVHEFMRLLQEYYSQERTVAFYAGKLCISPKYLSLLVREVTGRTAADLIDRFVINEAKNMLRFSGYTIQQVAYKLNFPNQSAFGKYFKHITGQSPTTFRST